MEHYPPTLLLRHRKENLKKCSLKGLEARSDCRFLTYPTCILPDLSRYVVLAIDAPPLSSADADRGILLIDGTWRYAGKMLQFIETQGPMAKRSIPGHVKTAYPRRQEDCPNPEAGLASIEALYLAYRILGRDTEGLLDAYYWKELFLANCYLDPLYTERNSKLGISSCAKIPADDFSSPGFWRFRNAKF